MHARARKTAPDATQLEFDFLTQPVAPLHRSVPAAAPEQDAPSRTESIQEAADALRQELCASTGLNIRLRITNNSSTMMSLRYDATGAFANVGLHHMFLEAPQDVRKALGAWILRPSAKVPGKRLEAYIAEQNHLIKRRPPRRLVVRTQGEHVDLKELYREVNEREFGGQVQAPITWGKMPNRQRRRSIRFGSYSPDENLIRIHPLLDQAFVPRYFVRYIVFHEMLHAYLGIEESESGRRLIHPPAFREREAKYADFSRAVAWMDNEKNLRRLLRTPRT